MNDLIFFCNKNNKIYIYGAGDYGRLIGVFLSENGIEFEGFVITNTPSTGYKVLGKSVKGIDEIDCVENYAYIVGISPKYQEDVINNLAGRGAKRTFSVTHDLILNIEEKARFDINIPIKKNIQVLCYHRVGDFSPDIWNLSVTKEHFEEQLRYLKSNYNLIGFADDWTDCREPSICITFDDGYYDFYENVVPLAEKYEVPVTVFVSNKNIGKNNAFWWDALEQIVYLNNDIPERIEYKGEKFLLDTPENKLASAYKIRERFLFMNNAEIDREIAVLSELCNCNSEFSLNYRMMTEEELIHMDSSPFVTIGGHTIDHVCLSRQKEEEQQRQIMDNKRFLEEILNHNITTFAYPFGSKNDYDDFSRKIAVSCGYKRIATTNPGNCCGCSDTYSIPRNGKCDMELISFIKSIKRNSVLYEDEYV